MTGGVFDSPLPVVVESNPMDEIPNVSLTREFLRGIDRAIEGTVNVIVAAPGLGLRLYRWIGWQRLLWIAAIVVGALIVIGGIAWIADGRYSFAYWQQGGDKTSRSEVFRNFGLVVVAVVGLGFGMWRAWTAYLQTRTGQRQAETEEQGQFTSRFTAAVEQLGSKQLPVRLGGIYALWRLAQDSPARDVVSVFDILCAFVRDPPHEKEKAGEAKAEAADGDNTEQDEAAARCRPDIQAILKLISEGNSEQRQALPPDYCFDLANAKLRDAKLWSANLAGANLRGADLTSAELALANLDGANLEHALLVDADLLCTNLTDANLSSANLRGAYLRGANQTGADLTDADLTEANLAGAHLTDANLYRADLTGAELTGANLSDANLARANLSGTITNGMITEGTITEGTIFPYGYELPDKD